ncbi:MAG: hypothetical protein M3Y75_11225 [Actinomycetota bacterium]|nr:hypothetical protein [Actinomycetota bacterium]
MRGLRRTTLSAVLAVLLLAGGAESARAYNPFNYGNPAFCEPRETLRDFGFSRLPPVKALPEEEDPPFAPPNVNVYGSGSFSVLTRRGSHGYGFSEDNFRGTVRLDWTVTAQMWLLGTRGLPVREVDSESLFIGELDASDQPHISLDTLGKRGFYRFDIQFADRNGTQLGAYSSYVKVVRPFWKARLGLDRRVYRPGQLVISRPENLGTEWMSYGADFSVQRWETGDWVPAKALQPGGFLLWLGISGPGAPGQCSALELPRDVRPGRYRIVKQVTRLRPSRSDRSYFLATPFRVRA